MPFFSIKEQGLCLVGQLTLGNIRTESTTPPTEIQQEQQLSTMKERRVVEGRGGCEGELRGR